MEKWTVTAVCLCTARYIKPNLNHSSPTSRLFNYTFCQAHFWITAPLTVAAPASASIHSLVIALVCTAKSQQLLTSQVSSCCPLALQCRAFVSIRVRTRSWLWFTRVVHPEGRATFSLVCSGKADSTNCSLTKWAVTAVCLHRALHFFSQKARPALKLTRFNLQSLGWQLKQLGGKLPRGTELMVPCSTRATGSYCCLFKEQLLPYAFVQQSCRSMTQHLHRTQNVGSCSQHCHLILCRPQKSVSPHQS